MEIQKLTYFISYLHIGSCSSQKSQLRNTAVNRSSLFTIIKKRYRYVFKPLPVISSMKVMK